jgi:hypothetical protein
VFCVSEKDRITKGDVSKKFGEPENHGDNIAFNVFICPSTHRFFFLIDQTNVHLNSHFLHI